MKGFRYGFGFVPNYQRILSNGGVPVVPYNALPSNLPTIL